MKTLKVFIMIIPLLAFFACKEKENGQTKTNSEQIIEEVEKYVDALKTNQYDDRNLPAFTYQHIDELLKYRNEKDIITKFPINPISSLWLNECELGAYVLWTIEYIRIKSVNSSLLSIGRFPSQNPILRLREEEFKPVFDVDAYQIASETYYAWWTNNQNKSLIEIMEIDPLENTIYKWH